MVKLRANGKGHIDCPLTNKYEDFRGCCQCEHCQSVSYMEQMIVCAKSKGGRK